MVAKKAIKTKKNKYRLSPPKKKDRFAVGKTNPPSVSLQQNLLQQALTLQQAGRLSEAEALYEQILSLQPNHAETLYYSGVLCRQLGMREKALEKFNRALASKPELITAYDAKINVLLALGKKAEAVATWRQLLALQPADSWTLNKYGVFLYELGRLDEALAAFKKAVSIKPDYATAHHNLGNVLRELGRLNDAIASFKKALSLKSDYVEAIRMLSLMEQHTEINDDIRSYEKMYTNGNLVDAKKIDLGFALGKIYEDLNDYDKAFVFLLEANRLKRRSYRYSVRTDYDLFERFKSTFSTEFFSSRRGWGNKDRTPLFIVGMPRSGSTLIEQILASHPQVFGAGEVSILSRIIYEASLRMRTKQVPECLGDLDEKTLAGLGTEYIEKVREYSADAKYITDKNLFNFLHVGLIKAILPNATIIHAIRDPMDNCLSIFKNYFINNKTCKFAYDLTELGQYYRLYHDLMKYWEKILPGFMHTVKYEELVSDPEPQVRSLLECCGLSWDEDCLSFYEKKRTVSTTSFMQVRKPIYKDSVALWRRYEKHLAPLRKALESPLIF